MSSNRQKINNTFLQKKRSQIKSKDIETSPKKQKIKIKTGPWDEKEDKLLKQWVEKNGAYNWTKCAEYMKFRTAKQCREHWKNNLDFNLKVGQWTSEEDLLIMKFYKKYESWRKMIPMFEGRTENSIKNRFFSQLRKIVVKKRPTGRKEYGTKYGLEILKNYLDEGIKQAELKYYEENKNMTKEGFESYMLQIENSINNRKKGKKFIDLNSIKRKNYNKSKSKTDINIHEDEKEYNQMNLEEKDENLETFNTTTKNKRGRKKATLNNMFKTTKNIDEPITREETTIPKDKPNFTKKKSKIIVDEKNIIKEEKIIEEENKTEKEKETEKINNDINNNNTNNILTRKMSRKLSKKLEEEKNKENINTKKENAFEDKFVRPQSYDDEFRVTMPTLSNNELQRSESIILNEDDNNNNKYKEKVRGRYNNGTSTNIENALKGKNINPIYSFAPQ